jgi:hypothetical protein
MFLLPWSVTEIFTWILAKGYCSVQIKSEIAGRCLIPFRFFFLFSKGVRGMQGGLCSCHGVFSLRLLCDPWNSSWSARMTCPALLRVVIWGPKNSHATRSTLSAWVQTIGP